LKPRSHRTANLSLLAGSLLVAGSALAQGAGGPYEMTFQFDQNGTPSMHTYVLKWPAPDASLATIDVLVSETQEVIQTITMPTDAESAVKLVWNDVIASKPDSVKDKFVEGMDYDFDKYGDLRVTREWPYKVGAKKYLVWLFDEDKNQYVLNEAISKLPGPVPNPKTRRIEATELGRSAGYEYTKRAYSINVDGKIKVQTKITQTAREQKPHTYLRDVRVRIAGELQRVCKIIVPAEGKPTKIWGTREACDKFLRKDLE
jgi:hypothetical protein